MIYVQFIHSFQAGLAQKTGPLAQPASISEAHEKSRFAVIDLAYDAAKPVPALDLKTNAALWLYGEAELECWRLQFLRERSQAAKLKVGYPGTFHTPYVAGFEDMALAFLTSNCKPFLL
jgi:hypothetical protein